MLSRYCSHHRTRRGADAEGDEGAGEQDADEQQQRAPPDLPPLALQLRRQRLAQVDHQPRLLTTLILPCQPGGREWHMSAHVQTHGRMPGGASPDAAAS